MTEPSSFHVRSVRGDIVETIHPVTFAMATPDGQITLAGGDPEWVTLMRSAAKPFQAVPLIEDGVRDAARMSSEELALTCASHNSETSQVALVERWLSRLGFAEDDLVCGPHRPLFKDLGFRGLNGERKAVTLAAPSRMASNCSGKHTGMLALAKHHGWPAAGYERLDHPVQQRARRALADSCGVSPEQIGAAVDGCGVVCWGMPLRSIATGYARLAIGGGALGDVGASMIEHPDLVAGTSRLCTALMEAYPGRVVAKVGAGGVYAAALMDAEVGLALKVHDGDSKAAAVALLAILTQSQSLEGIADRLAEFVRPSILNTNRLVVGHYEAAGSVRP